LTPGRGSSLLRRRRGHRIAATPNPPAARAPLTPLRRFAAAGATWLLLFLASPGILTPDGSLELALAALVPWGLWCSRPGRRAFLVEWLAAGIGLSAQTFWSVNVLWLTLLGVAIVPAFYMAVAGIVLRFLAARWSLAVAVPAAWIALETLNGIVEPPLAFTWMRLGHHAHARGFLLDAMRIVGTGGVGFALAATSGALADAVRARLERRAAPRAAFGFAAACLVASMLAGLLSAPPATVDGPRVLVVQPAFDAVRKQKPPSANTLFQETVALTRQGLARAERQGGPPDLVCWGETVFPWPLAEPGLEEAFDRGLRAAPWGQRQLTRQDIEIMRQIERDAIGAALFGANGGPRVIPPGTVFLTGVEEYVERDGLLRRQNAIVAFGEGGRRLGRGGKVHLVPGGESVAGLERIPWIRDTAFELAGYVPDFVAEDLTGVVELPLRGDRKVRVGLTVCFDNVFDGPYTEPTRRGPLDFHLIASNEAWYVETWEFDQMIAFSHCVAAATGRSMVRATNSGISVVIGPDGREVERLRAPDGRDRNVAGTLLATVPVPVGDPGPTIYARFEPAWRAAWVLMPLVLGLVRRRRDGYRKPDAR